MNKSHSLPSITTINSQNMNQKPVVSAQLRKTSDWKYQSFVFLD